MRISFSAAALLAILPFGLVPRGALAAKGDERPALRVLRNQGLERQDKAPSRWSLSREEEALRRYRNASSLNQVLAETQAAIQQLAMGDQNTQAMIEYCQGQMALRDARTAQIDQELTTLAGVSGGIGVHYHNVLVDQHIALIGEQRQLNAMINGLAGQRGANRQQLIQLQIQLVYSANSF